MTDVILQSLEAQNVANLRLLGNSRLGLSPFHATELPAVLDLLGRCSRETLFHRFHGFTGGEDWAYTLVAQPSLWTRCAWIEGRCVGIATFGGAPESTPELGVLVEDAWQRQGVGRILVDHLVDTMRGHGLREFGADILSDDVHLLSLLSRYGVLESQLSWGVYSVRVRLSEVGSTGQS